LTLATKVGPFGEDSGPDLEAAVRISIARSRERLRRRSLDLVQIHNATPRSLAPGGVLDVLCALRREGEVGALGASVYGEEAALAAITSGDIDVLQVAVNVLDQRVLARVVPLARERGVGLIARSVFLKGVLTPKAEHLPARLAPPRSR
jgi:aryl-alcohol dehydrogenase-like predicted oxidoreductase